MKTLSMSLMALFCVMLFATSPADAQVAVQIGAGRCWHPHRTVIGVSIGTPVGVYPATYPYGAPPCCGVPYWDSGCTDPGYVNSDCSYTSNTYSTYTTPYWGPGCVGPTLIVTPNYPVRPWGGFRIRH